MTLNTKELPQISFGRMVGFYTRDFRAGNAEAAVDYLTLICLNAGLPGGIGKLQASLCHEALRELVLETREFAQLLGDVRADGTRMKGAIEKRLKLIALADQEQLLRVVTIQAANVADDNGRVNDAVLLYHLAEDYDNVVSIVNRTLSEAIAVDMGQEQMRLQPSKPRIAVEHQQRQQPAASTLSLTSVDDPILLARNMIRLYGNNAMYSQKIRESNRDTCDVLIGMAEAKARTAAGHWSEAIDVRLLLRESPNDQTLTNDAFRSLILSNCFPFRPMLPSQLFVPVPTILMSLLHRYHAILVPCFSGLSLASGSRGRY